MTGVKNKDVKNTLKSQGRCARSKIGFPFMGEISEDKEQHNSMFVIACIFPVDIYCEYELFLIFYAVVPCSNTNF
jgi:hypothetical protein